MKNFIDIKRFTWLMVLFSGLAIMSCKKLIEIPVNPVNEIPTSAVFADSTDIMSAVAGIYYNFSTSGSRTITSGAITLDAGLSGDELVPSATAGSAPIQIYSNSILPNNGFASTLWTTAYTSLYQINACLAGISANNTISAALKQQLTGEIEVDRALYYFSLINLYGGVPLVTSTNYLTTESLPRAAVAAVYSQILADLTDAQKKLKPNYPSSGHIRPNLYVADALLAKVYLFMGQWQNAENAAASVINSGLYSLNTDLNTVYLDGSTEAIWQLPAKGTVFATAEAFVLIPSQNLSTPATTVVPTYSLSSYLLNAFEAGDQRLVKWAGKTSVIVNGVATTYYYAYKYKNLRAATAPTEDYMILRLAELYLIRAEAEAQLNNLSAALTDLNMVRTRAGLPNSTAVSQNDVLNAIMHERQIELFCEWGNRWYDLKRTGAINTVLGTEKTNWKSTDAVYPVPLSEIQTNPYLVQNPGY